jgi:hypothetical protein
MHGRLGAAVSVRVDGLFFQGRRGRVRPHEKGDKDHEIPTHRNLDRYFEEYIAAPTSARTARESDDGRGSMSAVPTELRMNCWLRQPHAEARG